MSWNLSIPVPLSGFVHEFSHPFVTRSLGIQRLFVKVPINSAEGLGDARGAARGDGEEVVGTGQEDAAVVGQLNAVAAAAGVDNLEGDTALARVNGVGGAAMEMVEGLELWLPGVMMGGGRMNGGRGSRASMKQHSTAQQSTTRFGLPLPGGRFQNSLHVTQRNAPSTQTATAESRKAWRCSYVTYAPQENECMESSSSTSMTLYRPSIPPLCRATYHVCTSISTQATPGRNN